MAKAKKHPSHPNQHLFCSCPSFRCSWSDCPGQALIPRHSFFQWSGLRLQSLAVPRKQCCQLQSWSWRLVSSFSYHLHKTLTFLKIKTLNFIQIWLVCSGLQHSRVHPILIQACLNTEDVTMQCITLVFNGTEKLSWGHCSPSQDSANPTGIEKVSLKYTAGDQHQLNQQHSSAMEQRTRGKQPFHLRLHNWNAFNVLLTPPTKPMCN